MPLEKISQNREQVANFSLVRSLREVRSKPPNAVFEKITTSTFLIADIFQHSPIKLVELPLT